MAVKFKQSILKLDKEVPQQSLPQLKIFEDKSLNGTFGILIYKILRNK